MRKSIPIKLTSFGDLGCSEKANLEPVAAAKIDQITAQLKSSDGSSSPFDPVERMKTGFIYFKKEKYEYVISFLSYLFQRHSPLSIGLYFIVFIY